MNTATAERPVAATAEVAQPQNAVVQFQKPRLPYHPAIQERFGVDASGWKAIVEAIFPAAKSVDSVVMALAYCRARNLDPFKRPVHIVPMWDSAKNGYVETVWPGIAELRTTAFRTENYAGCDEAEFGPLVEQTFTGRVKVKGNWEEKTVTVKFPEWCRITVYRDLHGRVCKFVGPKVRWVESYATIGASDIPNDMWQSRPEGQLEKCAEAAALRKAFPEELGNELTAEEMAGRRIAAEDAERVAQAPMPTPPPAPAATVDPPRAPKATPAKPVVIDHEPAAQPEPQAGLQADDSETLRKGLLAKLARCASTAAIDKFVKDNDKGIRSLSPDDRATVENEISARSAELYESEQRAAREAPEADEPPPEDE